MRQWGAAEVDGLAGHSTVLGEGLVGRLPPRLCSTCAVPAGLSLAVHNQAGAQCPQHSEASAQHGSLPCGCAIPSASLLGHRLRRLFLLPCAVGLLLRRCRAAAAARAYHRHALHHLLHLPARVLVVRLAQAKASLVGVRHCWAAPLRRQTAHAPSRATSIEPVRAARQPRAPDLANLHLVATWQLLLLRGLFHNLRQAGNSGDEERGARGRIAERKVVRPRQGWQGQHE